MLDSTTVSFLAQPINKQLEGIFSDLRQEGEFLAALAKLKAGRQKLLDKRAAYWMARHADGRTADTDQRDLVLQEKLALIDEGLVELEKEKARSQERYDGFFIY